MNFEIFVAICLVVCWASLPLSLVLAVKTFDDEMVAPHDDH